MPRKRTAAAEQTNETPNAEVVGASTPFADPARDDNAIPPAQPVAGREPGDDSHLEQPKKKWTPPENPRGWENIKGGSNRVRLLLSEIKDNNGRVVDRAWVIRFKHNPNEDKGPNGETYSKLNPHPVLKMLKEEGFNWNFDPNDRGGGWGKISTGDTYGTEHMEARRVLAKAAEMIGAPKQEQGFDRF